MLVGVDKQLNMDRTVDDLTARLAALPEQWPVRYPFVVDGRILQ